MGQTPRCEPAEGAGVSRPVLSFSLVVTLTAAGDKIHHSLDVMTLQEIETKTNIRRTKKPPETTLIVIDDMTVFLKQKDVEAKLRKIVFNRRHYYTSIMVLAQSYIAMPLDLRKTLSHFFLFKPRNKKESEAIWEELLFMSKKVGEGLLRFVFRENYDCLMGDANSGNVYRNFQLVETPEEVGDPAGDTQQPRQKKAKQG